MAQTRRRRPAPIQPPQLTALPESKGSDEALSELLESLGATEGFIVRIERRDARGGADYLGTVDLSPDLFDDVKEKFGGGKYRGRVTSGTGKYSGSITFGIAGAPRDAASLPAAVPEPAGLTRLEAIVAGLAETVRALATQPSNGGGGGDVAKFAEFAKIMRDLVPIPAAAPAGATATDTFAMFNQMLELRERIASDVEPRDGFGAMVDKGVTQLVPLLNRKLDIEERALQPRGEKRRRALAAPGTAPDVPSDPVAALAAKIPAMARSYLANLAKHDKNPELYAEVVLDSLPETVYARLPDLLGHEDFAARLCQAVPHFAPYPAWFARLADALRESLLADADENDAGDESPATEAISA